MSLKNCFVALALTFSIFFTNISCKSKVSDADLKAKVENVISNNSGVAVDVKMA